MTLATTRQMFATAALLAATACGPLSPEAQETNAYLRDLQPLLIENGHLSERVLILAAKVYNQEGDTDGLAQSWTVEVVPLAEHLHHQAQFVDPPEDWKERHSELVEIWGDRALAYRSLSESLVVTDIGKWKSARSQAIKVKLREEEWFKDANKALAPGNLVIDPTP